MQKVFAAANKYHLSMLVHFRSSQKWDGRANTEILLKQILPYAKNTRIVIAHMAGWGGYDRQGDKALELIAGYLHAGKKNRQNLYLDVSAVFPIEPGNTDSPVKTKVAWDAVAHLKTRIKQIGTDHIVFGTDWPLIDIDPYIQLLNKSLGEQMVKEILDTQGMVN